MRQSLVGYPKKGGMYLLEMQEDSPTCHNKKSSNVCLLVPPSYVLNDDGENKQMHLQEYDTIKER